MMKWKVRFCTLATSLFAAVALADVSVASLLSWYQPEIPEELK